MIIETIQFIIACGIVAFIVGLFLYKTYQVLRNEPPNTLESSAWKRIDAKVLASRVTERFRYGRQGLEVDLEYVIDGKRYTGMGQTVIYNGEHPPTTVELVYKTESPEAWEWLEDHPELTDNGSNTRFVIFFIWLVLILIGIGTVITVYFSDI